MASRCLNLLRIIRSNGIIHRNFASIAKLESNKFSNIREVETEKNLKYFGDSDTFGTLSRKINHEEDVTEEGDVLEEQYLQNVPSSSQKLTTRQYADLIKQYLRHKRLKEAIDVLEVRMLKEDRVKPENYIYNILIGACADVGYTKKAFKLYNEMKRRALQPTGDTYTCLFHACAYSPFPSYGLKEARNLRSLMIEKGVEPNITNYNTMIKAFGRCGDLPTAFQIVDEMMAQKIKIRVHTLNHLLHACISDKSSGLRHALVVWRKMLKLREKPNIYSFNLMLKCVKECNLGSKEDIEQLLGVIQEHQAISDVKHRNTKMITEKAKQREGPNVDVISPFSKNIQTHEIENPASSKAEDLQTVSPRDTNELSVMDSDRIVSVSKPVPFSQRRTVPNLLSKVVNMNQVLSLQEVHTQQDKFEVLGGQEDFLREMEEYSVKPDIKTFTQMLPLIEDSREAEVRLLDTMKKLEIRADIDFYNMLIKKRCLRSDYDGAFDVKNIIQEEIKFRKKKYKLKKKFKLNMNVMSYGMLALACRTKDKAEQLLNELKEKQLKVNIEILGTLLRQGTTNSNFGYILYIMNVVKDENIRVNDIFLKHLEGFNDKCASIIQNENKANSDTFTKAYRNFSKVYNNWLKEVDIEEALKPEHPWAQFQETYPETVQRQNINIKEPKKFYRKNKKRYVEYRPI